MIKLFILLCVFSQIKDIIPDKKWDIEIVTRKIDKYNLLAKGAPVTLTIEGPTYIRVYTRIPWLNDQSGSKIYKIIFQTDRLDEEIISLESQKSDISVEEHGHAVSKWRSFYIDVPEGKHEYKLINWSSPNDTIFVKFKYEAPKKWRDLAAAEHGGILEAIEAEKLIKYFTVKQDVPCRLGANGPEKLKITARLNYDMTAVGEQNFTLIVDNNGATEKFSFNCYKSETIVYGNKKDIVPSNARTFYIDLKPGWNNIKFTLAGTIAKSAGLRFQVEE